ncbi:hypothetical protein [Baaleninema simplex]|uniref:hypothetical protein n=1 Tax=Baaleninema simplex TaxID=2862350 RepID=UPI00130EDA4D|nr:hypothetical protein [Baaleninema simplex]
MNDIHPMGLAVRLWRSILLTLAFALLFYLLEPQVSPSPSLQLSSPSRPVAVRALP